MAEELSSLKKNRTRKLISILAGVLIILAIGGYFLYRNGYIFASQNQNITDTNQGFVTSFADKTYGIWELQHDRGQFQGTYRDFLVANIEESNYKQFPNIEDQATALANRFIDEMKSNYNYPEFFDETKATPVGRQLIAQYRNEFIAESDLLIRIIAASGDSYVQPISDMISYMKDPDIGGEMDIMTFARRGVPHTPIDIPVGSTTLTLVGGEVMWPFDLPANISLSAEGVERFTIGEIRGLLGNDLPILSEEKAKGEADALVRDLPNSTGTGELTDEQLASYRKYLVDFFTDSGGFSQTYTDGAIRQVLDIDDVPQPDTAEYYEYIARQDRARIEAENSKVLFNGHGTIAVNPRTGNAEYQTTLCYDPSQTGRVCMAQGSFSFDPTNNNFTADVSGVFSGKRVNLFSDPITGDVYIAVSRQDGEALYSSGKVGIVSAMVSQDGRIGGEFKYGDRMFRFNPTSNSFEVPIAIGSSGGIRFAQEGDTSKKGGDWGTVYVDSKGNVSGRVDVLGDQASIFFDRTGRVAVSANIKSGGEGIGSISVDSKGNISGTVNVGKFVGVDGLFVSVGKGGINGVNVPIGNFMGGSVGLGINKNGGLSIGGFIPIAGLPIPVGITQDSTGGFRLTWPGGSIGLIGGDDRSQRPPELSKDEDDNIDAGCIYFRHSFKKIFQTVRVYQEPCTKIEKEEQAARGKMIFDMYKKLLGRNPGLQEFMQWYFYSGHQLYKYNQHEIDKAYRMSATEEKLRGFITGKGDYARAKEGMENATANRDEYKWIKDGKSSLDAKTRPTDIMESNPFDESTWERVEEADETTGEVEVAPIAEFHEALLEDLQNDPGTELSKYYEKLNNIDPEAARANVDLGDMKVETDLVTRSGEYPVIEKLKDNTGLVITLRKGFNEVFTPDEVGYISLVGVESDGIKAFEYDPTYSTDANKSWIVSPQTMKPGTGYYLYNSGNADRKIILRKKPSLGAGEKDTVIKKGWNLLANSTSDTIKLGDYTVKTALSGWSGGCDIAGLCVGDAKIGDLISSDPKKTRSYQKLYFLVPETDSAKINKLTEVDALKSDYLKKIELKPGQIFWIYLYE